MTRPDHCLVRQSQQLLRGCPKVNCTASRKVGACGSYVDVEKGVPAEDVAADAITHVVWSVAGEMNGFDLHTAYMECFVVGEEAIENEFEVLRRYAVAVAKELLHLSDALTDSDLWSHPTLAQLCLDVRCSAQMVGVRVGLEDGLDLVSLLSNQTE